MVGNLLTPIEILLVEDNPDDVDLMIEAFQEGRLRPRVWVAEDGEEAVDFLRRQGRHANAPRPDLILLDLHLPRKNGHEVLADIKQDEHLRCIPVIVLTSVEGEQFFRDAYDLHANCCVCKPIDLDDFSRTVQKIERFWVQIAS